MNTAEFYDVIYLTNPHKWENKERDEFTFQKLSEFVLEPKSLIDIGCGNGHTVKHFAGEWVDTKFYGIDLSSEAIEIAGEIFPEGKYFAGDFMEAELPHCEVAICMGVAEHFEQLGDFLVKLKCTADLILLEVPNCLSYSDDKTEGFRLTTTGSDQEEWHISHDCWEKHIGWAGFEIVASIQGRTKATEFIWILK